MRRRWIADEVRENTAALTGEHAAHLVRVLRAEVGQQFDIATGDAVRSGQIVSISPDRVEFTLGDIVVTNSSPRITLALSIFKFDRMEWAIEKCTEIGAARIIPVIARRTDTHLASAAEKRKDRWQRLARQAAEQSRRTAPPEIAGPVKLKELLASVSSTAARIVLAESERERRFQDVLTAPAVELALAVGPEGGWSADELDLFLQSGWAPVSLGDTILRAETAAIVATALAVEFAR